MHFEFLVEDSSGKRMLDTILPRLFTESVTFRVIAYRGIGRLPKNLKNVKDRKKRILLDKLPQLIQGIGKTFKGYGDSYPAALIILCDTDNRCPKVFKEEIMEVYDRCNPKPETHFCFAIEEIEAWFLGDRNAILSVYSNAKTTVLDFYKQDSVCGTWELLADAIYPGGAQALNDGGIAGKAKHEWAGRIASNMDIRNNQSKSFNYFIRTVESLLHEN